MKHPLLRLRPALLLITASALLVTIHLIAAHVDWQSRQDSYPKHNYSYVEDGLCVGGMLQEAPEGIRAVLNVCETEDLYVAEIHRWQPIPDSGPPPGLDWLRSQVKFIDQQRKAGVPVYIHCRAGVNRSAMVVAAYLMWRDQLTRDEALQLIRHKRPRIGPFRVYQQYLLEWEKSLQSERLIQSP